MTQNNEHTQPTSRHPNTYMLGAYKRLYSWLSQLHSSKSVINKSICITTIPSYARNSDGKEACMLDIGEIAQNIALEADSIQLTEQLFGGGWVGVIEARLWTQTNEYMIRVSIPSTEIDNTKSIDDNLNAITLTAMSRSTRKRPGYASPAVTYASSLKDKLYTTFYFREETWTSLLTWILMNEVQDVQNDQWKGEARDTTHICENKADLTNYRIRLEPYRVVYGRWSTHDVEPIELVITR